MTDPFDRWWAVLPPPMKKSKELARRHWSKLWRTHGNKRWLTMDGMADFMIEAIRKQLLAQHFRPGYHPHGSTWLSAGRYDDDLPGVSPPPPKGLFDPPRPAQDPVALDADRLARIRERYHTPRPGSGAKPTKPQPQESGANWDAARAAIAVLKARGKPSGE